MPEVLFSVDQSKSMRDQAVPGHNRWHPDIPPVVSVQNMTATGLSKAKDAGMRNRTVPGRGSSP